MMITPVLAGFVVLGPFARTVLAHGNPVWREYSYLGGMDAIAMGCLTALLLHRTALSRIGVWISTILGSAFLLLTLGLGNLAQVRGIENAGLDMTVIGLGTCLLIAAAATTRWRGPRLLTPLLRMGQRSYEIYLTHMFLVFGFFAGFVKMGKPLQGVPVLFISVILAAAILGDVVARIYSEPLNRFLRRRWRDGPETLGSVVEDRNPVTSP